ncbi:hypothetical protein D3C80_2073500 [compost metagenome]
MRCEQFDIGLYEAFEKDPDRVAIRDTARAIQPGKTLEAHSVEQLELWVSWRDFE